MMNQEMSDLSVRLQGGIHAAVEKLDDMEWSESELHALRVWVHLAVIFWGVLKHRESNPTFHYESLTPEEGMLMIEARIARRRNPDMHHAGDRTLATVRAKQEKIQYDDRYVAQDILGSFKEYVELSRANARMLLSAENMIELVGFSRRAVCEEFARLFEMLVAEQDAYRQCRLVVDLAKLQIMFAMIVLERTPW